MPQPSPYIELTEVARQLRRAASAHRKANAAFARFLDQMDKLGIKVELGEDEKGPRQDAPVRQGKTAS